MSTQQIAIFGSNSKSAIKLSEALTQRDYEVIHYSSKPKNNSVLVYDIFDSESFVFDSKTQVAIYFSWDSKRRKTNQIRSAEAALRFGKIADSFGVKVLFISSLAAVPASKKSNYGNNKLLAEGAFRNSNHTIIRPATIVSDVDNRFSSSLYALTKAKPIVRLLSLFSGNFLIPVIDVEIFTAELIKEISNPSRHEWNLIQEVRSLNEIAGIKSPRINFPFPWEFLHQLPFFGEFGDRLITLIGVSNWIRENKSQP